LPLNSLPKLSFILNYDAGRCGNLARQQIDVVRIASILHDDSLLNLGTAIAAQPQHLVTLDRFDVDRVCGKHAAEISQANAVVAQRASTHFTMQHSIQLRENRM
jgi:hypothetical protein